MWWVDERQLRDRFAEEGHPVGDLALAGHDELRAATGAVLSGPEAWSRVRGWRAAGVTTGVVVATRAEPPTDRARLEPVVLLRDPSPEAVREAVERLGQGRPFGTLELAAGTVDLDRARFRAVDGAEEELSTLECRLVGYLGARSGRAISRDELQQQVWDHRKPIPTRAVDMAVSRLRKKIERDPARPATLLTSRHDGYRLLVATPRADPSVASARLQPGFVGRTAWLVEAQRALERHRAVVIVGPPGVGKSRTARQLAARYEPVRVVDLADVADPATLPALVASALGVAVPSGVDGLAGVLELAGDRRGALVLDHTDALEEHLAPLLDELAARLPGLVVVATRRVAGAGLPVRALDLLSGEEAEELLGLLAERAGLTLPASERAQLLTRLDGLPLVLELSIAPLRALGADGLLAELARPVRVLDGRTGALSASLDRSLRRLHPDTLALLTRSAVFAGPFRFEDLGALGPASLADWVEVADHALVVRREGWFHLLHSVRDRLRERLPPEVTARWVVRLAEVARSGVARLQGAEGRAAFDELAMRRPDLTAALASASAHGPPMAVARLAAALDRVVPVFSDRRAMLDRALGVVTGHPHAEALVAAARGYLVVNEDRAGGIPLLQRAERLARQVGDADLAVRVGMTVARALTYEHGRAAGLEHALAIVPAGADLGVRRQLEVLLLRLRQTLGEVTKRDLVTRMALIVDELLAEGFVHASTHVGLELAVQLRSEADPGLTPHLRRMIGLARSLPDRTFLAQALLVMARWCSGIAREQDALRALDEVAVIYRDERPSRGEVVIQEVRAQILSNGARYDEARTALEAALAWERLRPSASLIADKVLHLLRIEMATGRFAEARSCIAECRTCCESAGDRHLASHTLLEEVLLRLLEGRLDEADAVAADIDRAALSSMGRLRLDHQLAVLRRRSGTPDEGLESRLADPPPLAEPLLPVAPADAPERLERVWSRMVTDGLAGRREWLERIATTAVPVVGGVETRLLASLWLAVGSSLPPPVRGAASTG